MGGVQATSRELTQTTLRSARHLWVSFVYESFVSMFRDFDASCLSSTGLVNPSKGRTLCKPVDAGDEVAR
jgi:hypothetical protein